MTILEHVDEAAARARFPVHAPMSTSILGLHQLVLSADDPRPQLILERHGSLPVELVRSVLADLGFGLVLGPAARRRLTGRDYAPPGRRRRRQPG